MIPWEEHLERSIPACAGEPLAPLLLELSKRVYPRVCGGTATQMSAKNWLMGLSPRVRGNLQDSLVPIILLGSIPACAGEPREQVQC